MDIGKSFGVFQPEDGGLGAGILRSCEAGGAKVRSAGRLQL